MQLVITDTTSSRLFWNPYPHYGWIPANHLKTGMHLKTPDGQSAVVVGGSVPAVHDGWMWDLTVRTDHDFYVDTTVAAVLVHNCTISMDEAVNRAAAHVGDDAQVVRSGSGGVQFMSRSVDESGNTTMKIARFDANPNSCPFTGPGIDVS